jgi:hypothetical protein
MTIPIYVFIDTSIFLGNGFSVERTMFKTLRSLCDSKKVQLISTDITNNEINSNIVRSIKELKTEFKKIASKNPIITTIGGEGYKDFIDSKITEKISKEVKEQVDTYLKECNTQILNASEQSAKQVFDDYFFKKPPFGEGKKKYEFPDAFVLSALKNWCLENNTDIITISADKDFEKFCAKEKNFKFFPSLYEFINFILLDEDNIVAVIHKMVKDNEERISEKVGKEMEDIGVYLDDAEGEVFFIKIQDLSFVDISVVALDGNKAEIYCLVDTTLCFDVSYWDPDSWTSIKDDGVKEIFYHHRIEGEVDRKFTIEVEFEIQFNAEKFNLINIENIIVNSGADLEYSHYDFGDYF